jgi:hypothetical protein
MQKSIGRALGVLAIAAANTFALPFAGIAGDPTDIGIGESQFKWNYVDIGAGQVEFLFSNNGPIASAITTILFDDVDPRILQFSRLDEIAGVNYSEAKNLNLVGNSIGFVAEFGYNPSTPHPIVNAINPGDLLGIVFDLVEGVTFSDLEAALNGASGQTLQIGIHAQAFPNGGSAKFLNEMKLPVTEVPEPSALGLVMCGIVSLIGMGGVRRKI